MPFKFIKTPINELLIIEPVVFPDPRGLFFETYQQQAFYNVGITVNFLQDNQACSKKGTLRGLHFQKTFPQGKLVRVLRGKIFDAVVDLRPESTTFGCSFGVFLDDDYKKEIYVPPGFAHGYLALSEETEIAYKCTGFYHPEDEYGIVWNDPDINISWPRKEIQEIIISPKDQALPRFQKIKEMLLC